MIHSGNGSEDEEGRVGPVVIGIAVYPGSATAEDAHFGSLEVLAILEDNGVHGAVVEWTKGSVERL